MTDTESIRIGALVPYPPGTTPSQRYRIEQWIPMLASQGISVDLFPFADEGMHRLLYQPGRAWNKALSGAKRFLNSVGDVVRMRDYDVILIHRAIALVGPAVLERLLVLLGRPIVFDFDDAIFLLDTSEANRSLGWLKFPGKTATICRLSNHVVVGNTYLADYALRYNSRVTVIPTSVDTDLYRVATKPSRSGKVILGWTGSSTSQAHLEMFAPVLREVVKTDRVELRVHSDRRPNLPGIPFVWRPWSSETESREIGEFDIGIMPMPDNEWARGKCAMKALLYMASGIPTVCSAVGANCQVVSHGKSGFLAGSVSDWVTSLKALIDDPELRAEIGQAGRQRVEEAYSTHRSSSLFADVVRRTLIEWREAGQVSRPSVI